MRFGGDFFAMRQAFSAERAESFHKASRYGQLACRSARCLFAEGFFRTFQYLSKTSRITEWHFPMPSEQRAPAFPQNNADIVRPADTGASLETVSCSTGSVPVKASVRVYPPAFLLSSVKDIAFPCAAFARTPQAGLQHPCPKSLCRIGAESRTKKRLPQCRSPNQKKAIGL